jgi:hypothetical protein
VSTSALATAPHGVPFTSATARKAAEARHGFRVHVCKAIARARKADPSLERDVAIAIWRTAGDPTSRHWVEAVRILLAADPTYSRLASKAPQPQDAGARIVIVGAGAQMPMPQDVTAEYVLNATEGILSDADAVSVDGTSTCDDERSLPTTPEQGSTQDLGANGERTGSDGASSETT